MRDRRHAELQQREDTLTTAMTFAALGTVGLPGYLVGRQIWTWLREGYWPAKSLHDWLFEVGAGGPYTSWLGVQRIIDWLLSMPLSLAMLFIGLMLCWLISIPLTPVQEEMGRYRLEEHRKAREAAKNDA